MANFMDICSLSVIYLNAEIEIWIELMHPLIRDLHL